LFGLLQCSLASVPIAIMLEAVSLPQPRLDLLWRAPVGVGVPVSVRTRRGPARWSYKEGRMHVAV
jgi:hypothetical protein